MGWLKRYAAALAVRQEAPTYCKRKQYGTALHNKMTWQTHEVWALDRVVSNTTLCGTNLSNVFGWEVVTAPTTPWGEPGTHLAGPMGLSYTREHILQHFSVKYVRPRCRSGWKSSLTW